jgi:hypothetical protein
MIASALTLAAFVMTIVTLFKGAQVQDKLHPVAVQTPIND